jgi:hypothetical protein
MVTATDSEVVVGIPAVTPPQEEYLPDVAAFPAVSAAAAAAVGSSDAKDNLTILEKPTLGTGESARLIEVSSRAGLTTQGPAMWQSLAASLKEKAGRTAFPALSGTKWNATILFTTTDMPDGDSLHARLPLLELEYHTMGYSAAPLAGMAGNSTRVVKVDHDATGKPHRRAPTVLHFAPVAVAGRRSVATNVTKISHGTGRMNATTTELRDRGEARVRIILAGGSILALICVWLHACLGPAQRRHKNPEDILAQVYAEAMQQQHIQAAALLTSVAATSSAFRASAPDARL